VTNSIEEHVSMFILETRIVFGWEILSFNINTRDFPTQIIVWSL